MKRVLITLYSQEYLLDPHTIYEDDNDFGMELDAFSYSVMALDKSSEWTVEVDGKTTDYKSSDFRPFSKVPKEVREKVMAEHAIKDLNMEDYVKSLVIAGSRLLVRRLKSYAEAAIDIPEDEEFDPKKLSIVTSEWLITCLGSSLKDKKIAHGVLYDNKLYNEFAIEGGDMKHTYKVWKDRAKKKETVSEENKAEDTKPKVLEPSEPGRGGYIDKSGTWVIEPIYKDVFEFSEGLARVIIPGEFNAKKYDNTCFLDKTGQVVINTGYPTARDFHEGLAAVNNEFYIDTKGERASFIDKIPYEILKAYSFHEGVAVVGCNINEELKFGVIDKDGNILIPFEYHEISDCSEGIVVCTTHFRHLGPSYDENIIRSIDGHYVGKRKYFKAFSFREGLCRISEANLYGFIDKEEKYVIPPFLYNARSFSEGLAAVQKKYSWNFINKENKTVIRLDLKDVWDFHNGFATVKPFDPPLWGLIDKEGNYVIEPQYDELGDVSEGLLAFRKGERWGFLDTTGKVIIEPIFEKVTNFKEGLAGAILPKDE